MENYEKHVINERESNIQGQKMFYRGNSLAQFDWAFENAEHALNSIDNGSLLIPCPKCKKRMLELLQKN